jgi:hypothetical protein
MFFLQYIEEKMLPILAARNIKPVKFNFSSLNEFLNNEFIRFFTRDPRFSEFVICRNYSENELIVKFKTGDHHKIGFLDGDIIEIPEWSGQKIIVATKKSLII